MAGPPGPDPVHRPHQPEGGRSSVACVDAGVPFTLLWEFYPLEATGDPGKFLRAEPPDFVVIDGLRPVIVRMGAVEAESGQRLPRNLRIGAAKGPPDGATRLTEQFEVGFNGRAVPHLFRIEEFRSPTVDDLFDGASVPEHVFHQATRQREVHPHSGTFSDSTCGSTAQCKPPSFTISTRRPTRLSISRASSTRSSSEWGRDQRTIRSTSLEVTVSLRRTEPNTQTLAAPCRRAARRMADRWGWRISSMPGPRPSTTGRTSGAS
jgi:hypothetical protein